MYRWRRSVPHYHRVRLRTEWLLWSSTDRHISLTVSTRMADDDFSLSLDTLKFFILNLHNLALWLPAFVLAVLLRIITHKYHHQLIFPICAFPTRKQLELCSYDNAQISSLFLSYSTSSSRQLDWTWIPSDARDGYLKWAIPVSRGINFIRYTVIPHTVVLTLQRLIDS